MSNFANLKNNHKNYSKKFYVFYIYFRITWSNVVPYTAHSIKKTNILSNSFQCIILTESTNNKRNPHIYAIFNYFTLTWPNKNFNKNLIVGFKTDENNNVLIKNFEYQKDFSLEFSAKKSQEIIIKLMSESNCNRPGKWIFRIDHKGDQQH